jgi:hypothetical protein
MRSTTSDDLIQTLVSGLKPVRRLPRPGLRALRWMAAASLCVFAVAALFGFRSDLALQLQRARYLGENAVLALACVLAARSAFELSVPRHTRELRGQPAAVLGFLAWVLLVTQATAWPESSIALPAFWISGLTCVRRTALLALAPTLAMFWMVRRSAPLEYRWPSAFAGLAAALLATLGTQAICANDAPWHVLLWHAGPVLITTIAGSLLGTRFSMRRC